MKTVLIVLLLTGCSNMTTQGNAVFFGTNAYILHQIYQNQQAYDKANKK